MAQLLARPAVADVRGGPTELPLRAEPRRPALEPGAPAWRGIVEEAWPSAEHVTDPMLFYCAGGDPEVMKANIETMLDHVTRLTDLDYVAEHDDERVDHEDDWSLRTRWELQPGRACSGPRALHGGRAARSAESGDWRPWAELFTEDAEVPRAPVRPLQGPRGRSTSGSSAR